MLEFKMSGDLQLDRALYAMERKAARNTITKAVRRTLRPITTTVRSRIKNELSTMNAQARAQYSKQIDLSIRVERGGVVPESDLSPAARAILERMSRVAYVLDQHKLAIARHSRHLAELRGELEALEVRQ